MDIHRQVHRTLSTRSGFLAPMFWLVKVKEAL